MNHIRSQQHQVRKPYGNRNDMRFYKTYCKQYVRYASTTPIATEDNCPLCVKGLVEKREKELEKIKFFLDPKPAM